MNFHPDYHHRQSIRLKGYNYAQPGVYFVTLFTGTPPTGNIQNQGNLAVESGETLAFYGNQVTSTGTLTAPGGTVNCKVSIRISGNANWEVKQN